MRRLRRCFLEAGKPSGPDKVRTPALLSSVLLEPSVNGTHGAGLRAQKDHFVTTSISTAVAPYDAARKLGRERRLVVERVGSTAMLPTPTTPSRSLALVTLCKRS